MESKKTFEIIVIVTLITILTPVESKWVPIRDLFVARSLLSGLQPSISPESPAPAPVMEPVSIPANPPTEIDIDSSENLADSISLTNLQKNPVTNLLKQTVLSPIVKTICSQTDSPPLCESSVSPLITADLKLDPTSVLALAIQASVNANKAIMATVNKVAAAECQEFYDDAMANLDEAVNAVKSRDIATVNINLSAAMTDYGTCNDSFEEMEEPNPLADVGEKLTKMVSNCLAISTLIK